MQVRRPIRPLASFRRDAWRPGPPFWGPTAGPADDGAEPEHVLLNLAVPMYIAASVFISMLFILA